MQAAAYYMGMLAYYWVLATPAVGFLFGCYLYIAVNWFHVHYDEAFSALRIPNFKGFSRLHINTDGDLEVYGLAMDKVSLCLQHTSFGAGVCLSIRNMLRQTGAWPQRGQDCRACNAL